MRGDPIKTPYFLKQLQVLSENDYFPWIVNDALKLLESQDIIQSFTQDSIKDMAKFKHLSRIKFFVNSMIANNLVEFEKAKAKAYNICKFVNKYSNPPNNFLCRYASSKISLVQTKGTRLQNN